MLVGPTKGDKDFKTMFDTRGAPWGTTTRKKVEALINKVAVRIVQLSAMSLITSPKR